MHFIQMRYNCSWYWISTYTELISNHSLVLYHAMAVIYCYCHFLLRHRIRILNTAQTGGKMRIDVAEWDHL